jgi:Uma2 family endonuclease
VRPPASAGGVRCGVESIDQESAMQATVHLSVPISDADLERISDDNPGWKVEREGNASLVMSPTSSTGSAQNSELTFQLAAYAKRLGGKAFDSSGGFTLPDTSVLSPDGA